MEGRLDSESRTALIFLAFGVLSFGFSGVLIKLCRFPPATIASFRMVLAGAVLTPFCFGAWRRFLAERGLVGVLLLLVPGLLLGLHFHAWVAGLKRTTVANGTFIFSLNPVFFALAERFVRRRRIPPYAVASLAMVVAGAWWLLVVQRGSLGRSGDLLCLAATLLFVVYLLVSRRVTRAGTPSPGQARRVPHHLYIHILYLGGGLATLPLVLLGGSGTGGGAFGGPEGAAAGMPALGGFLGLVIGDTGSLLALIGLALFPTLIGHTANNFAVRFLQPLTVSFFTLAEPILATVSAAFVLGEVPAALEVPTYALFLAATVLYLVRSRAGPLEQHPGRRAGSATSGRRTGSSR